MYNVALVSRPPGINDPFISAAHHLMNFLSFLYFISRIFLMHTLRQITCIRQIMDIRQDKVIKNLGHNKFDCEHLPHTQASQAWKI